MSPTENKKSALGRIIPSAVGIALLAALLLYAFAVVKTKEYLKLGIVFMLGASAVFLTSFEKRRPQAREIVMIAALTALATAGRAVFFFAPQFKPVIAIAIVAGVSFGPQSGFVTGMATGFVSNFLYGQGVWTPWQMFGFGLVGFLAGAAHLAGILPAKRLPLCVFGGIATMFVYGIVMDVGSYLMFTASSRTLWAVYVAGIPFNIVHSAATVFFLFFLGENLTAKLSRLKIKYGLLDGED